MRLPKLSKLFVFLRYIRLFGKKEVEPYYLFVIDGPASIAMSRLIVKNNTSLNLRFIASANFLTRLDDCDTTLTKYLVGWQLSTLVRGGLRFLVLCKDIKRILHFSDITRCSNAVCVEGYIRSNASWIKSVIVFNERSPFTVLAVSTAKNYGIDTACIQHGAVVENYFPTHVDRYFTWSDYYSGVLQKRAPGLKTICVGRLGYKIPENFRNDEKNDGPLLVLQPADVSIARDELLGHFREIIDVCYQHFNKITLRPHPNDNIINDIVGYIDKRLYSIESGRIEESLSRYSITISLYSTVLLESSHYGSLPIQYLKSNFYNELMRRCEVYAESPEKLYAILDRVKDESYFSKHLSNSKEYSERCMKSGDIKCFFSELKVK